MTTQIQEAAALISALIMGYGIGRYHRHKYVHRCHDLAEWETRDASHRTSRRGSLRCEQDEHHSGPHCARFDGEMFWWEEPDAEGQ